MYDEDDADAEADDFDKDIAALTDAGAGVSDVSASEDTLIQLSANEGELDQPSDPPQSEGGGRRPKK